MVPPETPREPPAAADLPGGRRASSEGRCRRELLPSSLTAFPRPRTKLPGHSLVTLLSLVPIPQDDSLFLPHPSKLIPAFQVCFLNDHKLSDANGRPSALSLPNLGPGNFNAFFFLTIKTVVI